MGIRAFCSWFFRRAARPGHTDVAIFGLGNPGFEHRRTRHNAGFRIIDKLEGHLTRVSCGRCGDAEYVQGVLPGGRKVSLVKPTTFMNRSGTALAQWIEMAGIPLSSCLVIVDDFNLPLGTIRMRKSGSPGGHNGLKSIIEKIGPDVPRLRIGIGPLPGGIEVIGFVLSDFNEREEEKLPEIFERAADAVLDFSENGIEHAMSVFNK